MVNRDNDLPYFYDNGIKLFSQQPGSTKCELEDVILKSSETMEQFVYGLKKVMV